jgi:regulator of replication initiation timing
MGHPIIDEFCRVYSLGSLQAQAFRRMQRVLRDEVQPQLDERDKLIEENAALKAENSQLSEQLSFWRDCGSAELAKNNPNGNKEPVAAPVEAKKGRKVESSAV